MLSETEKQEMLEDSRNAKRGADFAKAREASSTSSRSLDDYIQFLDSIQKVFPFRSREWQAPITKFNRI